MKLSEQELRWLNRWEKRERRWLPITRWVMLAICVSSLALGVFAFYAINHIIIDDGVREIGWLMLVPIYFFINAGLFFGITFSKWRGDIKLRLLLRLIREHENSDA